MEIAQSIASQIDSLRRIEGFLTRLFSEAGNDPTRITLELTNRLFGVNNVSHPENSAKLSKAVVPQDVIEAVSQYYSVTKRKLLGEGRSKPIVGPRQVLMYLLRIELDLSLKEAGYIIGGRDHTTIMHGVAKIIKNMSTNEGLRHDVLGIKKAIFG